MGLFAKLFPKAAELQKANDRIEVLEVKHAELTQRNKNLWDSCNANERALQDKSAELAKVLLKVREQTDADLMLVSARIIAATLKGEKPSLEDLGRQTMLIDQQTQLRNSYPYGASMGQGALGGLFGTLGGAAAAAYYR